VIATTSVKRSPAKKRPKRAPAPGVHVGVRNKPLSALTDEALRSYFANLNGHKPGDLYQLVMREVERPLLIAVLSYTNGNQCEAADILGINRGTLRKKLKAYKLNSG
jgi:Fis family transcriptional regulator, factor for inversion stimulation protein